MQRSNATKLIWIDKVCLEVPVSVNVPYFSLSAFPDSCGAGKGLREKLIPDKFYWLRMSAACWIHDKCWEFFEKTRAGFDLANDIFLRNMKSIIKIKSTFWGLRCLRYGLAGIYHKAVSLNFKYFMEV